MSQSSDNPIRQGRRGRADGILRPDPLREHEIRRIARTISQAEMGEIAQLWLAGEQAGDQGDADARDFFRGTFGPWAAEIMRIRRS